MSLRVSNYCRASLLANGWFLANANAAYAHADEHWTSPASAISDFHNYTHMVNRYSANCKHFICESDAGEVEVYAKSEQRLAERIEEVTGMRVIKVRPYSEPELEAEPVMGAPNRVTQRRVRRVGERQ